MTAHIPGDRARSPLGRLWRLADPSRARLALAAALAFGALASSVALLVTSAWLISRASQQPPILYLQVAIVAVRAFGISRGVLRYAERLVGHDVALRALVRMRVAVYERLERLSPAGLGRHRRGDLLARLVGDVDATADLIVRVLLPAVAGLAAGALAVLIGALILPAAGMVLLALWGVAGVAVPVLTSWVARRSQAARARAEGELTERVVADLSAARELLAYGGVDAALSGIAAADARLTAIDRRAARGSGIGAGLATLATGLAIAACLGLGVAAVSEERLDGVWLAALALIPLAMADVLSGMPTAALARSRVAGAARRLFEILDAPDPVPGCTPSTVGPASEDRPDSTPARAVLTGLGARYPGALVEALAGVDLDLAEGRRIALVGPSGSGKSTAAAVLLRLLDHDAGRYELDGTDVRDLPEENVRLRIAAVDQDVHLFDTTIEENLRLANRSATPAELRTALERAALADWVDALPQGLATRVGAHGSAVSGGEAQRIGLARALLTDRPLVVLDEPGEHLDQAMADQVTADALRATQDGRGVLLITHRMAHVAHCDEVVVLAEGRVAARGTPDDVVDL